VIVTIPIGVGFKYQINKKIILDARWMHRITFSDHIDDVSSYYNDSPLSNRSSNDYPAITAIGEQRGNKMNRDHFFSFEVGISYRLDKVAFDQKNAFKKKRKPVRFFKRKKWTAKEKIIESEEIKEIESE
jgi:hypothetical protein